MKETKAYNKQQKIAVKLAKQDSLAHYDIYKSRFEKLKQWVLNWIKNASYLAPGDPPTGNPVRSQKTGKYSDTFQYAPSIQSCLNNLKNNATKKRHKNSLKNALKESKQRTQQKKIEICLKEDTPLLFEFQVRISD